MKSCLHCNGQNREQARFCGHCGSLFPALANGPLTAAADIEKGTPDSTIVRDHVPRSSFKTGMIAGVVLLLIGQMLWSEAASVLTQLLKPKDIVENRRAAAQRYQAVAKLEDHFAEAVRAQAKQMPTGLHEMIFKRITENIRIEKLKSAQCELLVKYFTVQELEALQRFYGTPEGASLQSKLAKLHEEFEPQVMTEALHAVQETLRELQEPPSNSPSAKGA